MESLVEKTQDNKRALGATSSGFSETLKNVQVLPIGLKSSEL